MFWYRLLYRNDFETLSNVCLNNRFDITQQLLNKNVSASMFVPQIYWRTLYSVAAKRGGVILVKLSSAKKNCGFFSPEFKEYGDVYT